MSLRLVDTVRYRLYGSFFKKGFLKPEVVTFHGLIRAGYMGEFSGIIVDQHGPSKIKGHLIANVARDRLDFEKCYDVNHPSFQDGTLYPIKHEMSFSDSGGWEGDWFIENGQPADQGYITMAILPWNETTDFPLDHDLAAYLSITLLT